MGYGEEEEPNGGPTAAANLAAAMRAAREAQGISRRQFARRLGWSHSNLADYENGHRVATAEVVQVYETALGLAPGSLLEIWQVASDRERGKMRERRERGSSLTSRDRTDTPSALRLGAVDRMPENARPRLTESAVTETRPVSGQETFSRQQRWRMPRHWGPRAIGALAALMIAMTLFVIVNHWSGQLPSRASTREQPIERQWDCRASYSCYYDGYNGTGDRWVAPGCGSFNLGEGLMPFNDKISSIWNRSAASIDLYNWDGTSQWIYLARVPPDFRGDIQPSIDNIVDRINVVC